MGVQMLCDAIPTRHKIHYSYAMYESPYREERSGVGVDPGGIRLFERKPTDEQDSDKSIDIIHESRTSSTKPESFATSNGNESHDDDFLLLTRSAAFQPRRPARRPYLTGWRPGAVLSLVGAIIVTIFNIIVTIWVWKNPENIIEGTIGTLSIGNCGRTRRLNVRIHLLVNILSTLLLCASNYCMQVLSAPNRVELDRAHAQRVWLHIGVPNLRNFRHIGRSRLAVWLLLLCTSVPLHLFFNSVVFAKLQANNYAVLAITDDWFHGAPYDTSNFRNLTKDITEEMVLEMDKYRPNLSDVVYLRKDGTMPRYKNISTSDCFTQYDNHYVSGVGNVYLVQDNPTLWRNNTMWQLWRNPNTSYFVWDDVHSPSDRIDRTSPHRLELTPTTQRLPEIASPEVYPSNAWRCPSHVVKGCDVRSRYEVPHNRSDWRPYGSRINHCIVEQVEEFCKLQFSFSIALAVILSNIVKVACIAATLFICGDHAPLVTVGDVVATYLDEPDPTTRNRCLYSRQLIESLWEKEGKPQQPARKSIPQRYNANEERWRKAPSESRWIWTYATYFAVFVFGIPSLYYSLVGMPSDPRELWQIGFGTVNGANLFSSNLPLVGSIMLANTPQVLLSYFYLAFNALYTNMLVAHEWASYLNERKPLRVTSPRGGQRDTHWLNVPFRYAIPMTIISGLFHWLASQSVFMVRISITDQTRQPVNQISTVGYSPMAIILTLVIATIIAGFGAVLSCFKYPAGIPLAASCSVAISAACHPPMVDQDASLRPVQWGASTHSGWDSYCQETVGHCSFSSLPVELPISGRLYA